MNIKTLERIHTLLQMDVKASKEMCDEFKAQRDETYNSETDSYDPDVTHSYEKSRAVYTDALYALDDFETEEW